jgi:hypothetical protein
MNKFFWTILIWVFFFGVSHGQIAAPSSADKSVVYFLRSPRKAEWVKFSLYDSTRFIGKIEIHSYLRYECSAGYHLFWAQSENNDFVEAELGAGKIYFIQAFAEEGMNKARVNLIMVFPDNEFLIQRINAFISSQPSEEFTEAELQKEEVRRKKKIKKALSRYEEDKYKGKLYGKLTKEMGYELPE